MREVGPDNPYHAQVGKTVRIKQDVWLLGISLRNQPPVEYYVLVGGVGFTGREVVARGRVRGGTMGTIIKVLKDDSILVSRMTYVVRLNDGKHAGKEAEIRLHREQRNGPFVTHGDDFEIVDEGPAPPHGALTLSPPAAVP